MKFSQNREKAVWNFKRWPWMICDNPQLRSAVVLNQRTLFLCKIYCNLRRKKLNTIMIYKSISLQAFKKKNIVSDSNSQKSIFLWKQTSKIKCTFLPSAFYLKVSPKHILRLQLLQNKRLWLKSNTYEKKHLAVQKISNIFSFLCISSLPLQTFSSYGGFTALLQRP